MLLTEGFQPGHFLAERLLIRPLGHKEHSVTIYFGQCAKVAFYLVHVFRPVDHEFDLVRIFADKPPNDVRLVSPALVLFPPPRMKFSVGRGIAEFGADRHEMALDRPIYRARRFHRHVVAAIGQMPCERDNLGKHHRFAARQHDMASGKVFHTTEDLLDGEKRALRFPACVRGITEPAPEVAS